MSAKNMGKDKRQAIRITTRLLFGQQTVAPEKFEAIQEDVNQGISLYNRSELADIQVFIGAQSALSKIRDRDEDMASFLQHLDGKMNLLLRKIDATPSILDSLTLQRVNIGGNGLAFWAEEPANIGEIRELHVVLPPNNCYINCFGEVVDCQQDADDEDGIILYRIAVKFLLIMEPDRESMIQFNFKQQGLALQRRRLKR